jgi:hypothetical protein
MKHLLRRAAMLGGILAMSAQSASAQHVAQTVHLTNPAAPFAYSMFTVAVGGQFNLFTTSTGYDLVYGGGGGNQTDPMFHLFRGLSTNGSGLGSLVASNDDGYGACGSPNDRDACLSNLVLTAGNYTLATSLWLITEQDARSNTYQPADGEHYSWTNASFDVNIDALNDGEADFVLEAAAVVATPEPASAMLVATGMLGLVGVALRRRSA